MTKAKAIEILNELFDSYLKMEKACLDTIIKVDGKQFALRDKLDEITDEKIAMLTAIDALQQSSNIEAEPEKQDTQLSVILQDFGIDNAEQLCYILEQYQKVMEEITGGQMSYLTYLAQAVIECANDRYLSALTDLKEDERWTSI